jgi:hypothetical protein
LRRRERWDESELGKIIWLASYPKSGNTWVRAFLANLFSGAERPFDINALDQFCSTLTARARFDRIAGAPTLGMPEAQVLGLRGQIQRNFCAKVAESAFMKTHSRFGDYHGLALIEPECTAGAIYIVRNPLDVAVSAASHYGVSLEYMVGKMADPNFRTEASDRHVNEYIGSWSQNVVSWTVPAHPKIHVMRYEDMYEQPEAAFERLVAFLGLKPPAEQLDRAIRFSRFNVLSGQEQDEGFKERSAHNDAFFRRGRPGEGREKLAPDLIDAIVSAHGTQMARFGYT